MAPLASKSVLHVNGKDVMHLLQDDKWEALYEPVAIIPKLSTDTSVDCVQGQYGPFRAHAPMQVPLWAALDMEAQQQCSIELPKWMQEEELKIACTEEKASPTFTAVPRHYIEIAYALLARPRVFGGNEKWRQKIVLLLRELIELRRSKILESMKAFDDAPAEFRVTHMAAAEMTCFRTRSMGFLDAIVDLLRNRNLEADAEMAAESAPDDSHGLDEDSSRPI
mmetsp:Transcript_119815/g.284683  ORF Transcript_119815/g.284683 Transcript_119815/m.284683 type:complete len:223 (+) Transcript_119815:55-723(+)|eukprot:CAMPEP_0181461354 /NCGR_PEP_ID=MMETSP1110-20121109/33837_1 /TAXON_ID=174948 /ORGANISM="Symbiodinium sp., Strain CCMP421" /LENGTH=222 /DNA_ID=CAMNT_0023585981 /DNA_START=48 /DNA_END=716 /DNA_ORIENTATION=-